ncbi:MAG: malectin domain-containing carbohydrate-binding protein [bacterium]
MYFDQAGKRVFNVLFGEKVIVENLDIFQKVLP